MEKDAGLYILLELIAERDLPMSDAFSLQACRLGDRIAECENFTTMLARLDKALSLKGDVRAYNIQAL